MPRDCDAILAKLFGCVVPPRRVVILQVIAKLQPSDRPFSHKVSGKSSPMSVDAIKFS